jgi:hypothetical protein
MKEIGNTEDTVFNNIMEQFADSFEQTKVFSLLDAIAYLAHDFKKQEANIRRIFTVYEEVQSDILYDPNVNSYRIWIDGELQKHDNKVPVGFEEKAQYHQLDVSSRMDLIDVVDLLFTQWALGGKDFSDAFDQNLPIEQRFIRIIDMTKTPDERFNEVVKYTGVGDLYQYFINVNNTLGCNTTKTKIDFLVFDSLTWKDEPFFSYAKKQ